MRGPLLLALVALSLLGFGCSDEKNLVNLDWSLNRMNQQERYTPFKEASGFRDGRTMQPPPAGTVPRGRTLGPLPFTLGVGDDGAFVDSYPLPMTRELIELGQNRFDRTCAACHGILGTSDSEVASKMPLIKPPSLHSELVLGLPLGRIYQVATFGYGLMPSYGYQLTDTERWAVVAYIKALQLSQAATLSELPPELQRSFRSEVP